MDKRDIAAEKLKHTPQAIAFQFQEQMVLHFCQHYHNYIKRKSIHDEKLANQTNNLNKILANKLKKKLEKIAQNEAKEQADILAALKKIKDSLKGYNLKKKEIDFLRNLFMEFPLLSNDILNPKCKPTKEYSLNLIKSKLDEAKIMIKECGKDPQNIKLIPDPDFRNTTLCDTKHNTTSSDYVDLNPVDDNPQDPKVPKQRKEEKDKEDEKEKKNFKMPIDDRTLYLDDGDFYRNIKADLINAYKNRERKIIVPRSIPLQKPGIVLPQKIDPIKPPIPVIPKKPDVEVKSEEDELVIPVQDTNPGVIKKDDEKAIAKILVDSVISDKDCDKNKKLNQPEKVPIIPNPKYVGYPPYRNITQLKTTLR